MTDKNLGHATAYGYAKSKGYTGTEEEFAELMASYAEVATDARGYAEQAEQSASNAQTSATNASASATTAGTKASEASASALSAQQSATSASTSAGNASASANSASTSAQTATTKASEAEQSATSASESATSANSAKEDAVTAKEEAQASAEEAKASEEAIDLELAKLDASLITDTATGNPSIFPDGANLPVKSLTAEINPVQDLNGYDYPWVGGAGKNQYNGADIIFNGRPSDSTLNGITLTKNSDGSFTVTGTATAETRLNTQATYQFKAGKSYTISVAGLTNGNIRIVINGSVSGSGLDYTSEFPTSDFAKTYTITADCGFNCFFLDVQNGATVNNTIKIQIEQGSTATSYAPYENICPITGYDSVEVTRTGVNVWDEEWEVGGINDTTGINSVSPNQLRSKNYVHVFPNMSYYFYIGKGTALRVFFYDADKNFLNYIDTDSTTATTPPNAHYLRFRTFQAYGTTYLNDISINYPSTDYDYHPAQIQSITVTLNDTTYGGTLNVSTGELTVDSVKWTPVMTSASSVTMTGGNAGYRFSAYAQTPKHDMARVSETISNFAKYSSNWVEPMSICPSSTNASTVFACLPSSVGVTSASEFNNWVTTNGYYAVYKLAEPQTIQLTASQLSTILGTNVISADSGAVTVEYYANTKLYINKVVNAQS